MNISALLQSLPKGDGTTSGFSSLQFSNALSFVRILFVFLLRAGYVLVQIGSIPTENVYIILLQNIVDVACSILAFCSVGYTLAFGKDFKGVFGLGVWVGAHDAHFDQLIFGLSAVLIGSAIVTTVLTGRVHFFGYLLISLLYSGLVQPVVMHWVWHQNGLFKKRTFLKYQVAVKDQAGALPIHTTSGMTSLVALTILGRRLIKLNEIDESSVGTESPGSTLVGYVLITVGLIAFSIPSDLRQHDHDYFGLIIINDILGMCVGALVVIILSLIFSKNSFHYWVIINCAQGALAGLVSIAAGVDVFQPVLTSCIAFCGGILFYLVSRGIFFSALEDYCNVIATNLVCGSFGMLMPPLLASGTEMGLSVRGDKTIHQLAWQFFAVLAAAATVLVAFSILFGFLFLVGFLRNKNEKNSHERSLILLDNRPDRCCLERVFPLYKDTTLLEPGPNGKSPDEAGGKKSQNFDRTRTPSGNYSRNYSRYRDLSQDRRRGRSPVVNFALVGDQMAPFKSIDTQAGLNDSQLLEEGRSSNKGANDMVESPRSRVVLDNSWEVPLDEGVFPMRAEESITSLHVSNSSILGSNSYLWETNSLVIESKPFKSKPESFVLDSKSYALQSKSFVSESKSPASESLMSESQPSLLDTNESRELVPAQSSIQWKLPPKKPPRFFLYRNFTADETSSSNWELNGKEDLQTRSVLDLNKVNLEMMDLSSGDFEVKRYKCTEESLGRTSEKFFSLSEAKLDGFKPNGSRMVGLRTGGKLAKVYSSYKVKRTKKLTNLHRKGSRVVNVNCEEKLENEICHKPTKEDELFDDGFITIKPYNPRSDSDSDY